MNTDKIYLEAEAIDALIDEMTLALKNRLAQHQISAPVMIGIHTGGVWLAEHLHQRLEITEPLGTLDISFYRDDFTRIGMNPQVKPSQIPFSVDDRHIILVDDVLHTGRTIRAALNEHRDRAKAAFGAPGGHGEATLAGGRTATAVGVGHNRAQDTVMRTGGGVKATANAFHHGNEIAG